MTLFSLRLLIIFDVYEERKKQLWQYETGSDLIFSAHFCFSFFTISILITYLIIFFFLNMFLSIILIHAPHTSHFFSFFMFLIISLFPYSLSFAFLFSFLFLFLSSKQGSTGVLKALVGSPHSSHFPHSLSLNFLLFHRHPYCLILLPLFLYSIIFPVFLSFTISLFLILYPYFFLIFFDVSFTPFSIFPTASFSLFLLIFFSASLSFYSHCLILLFFHIYFLLHFFFMLSHASLFSHISHFLLV